MMGCFTVLKNKKKKSERLVFVKPIANKELVPTALPEPQVQTRSLRSAPPSFRTRVKLIHLNNMTTRDRTCALSAPPSFDAAEQDALASAEFEEQEDLKSYFGLLKEPRSPGPRPLPLPSPCGTVLKTMGSFKLANASVPLFASGPLPLPPCGTLRNYGYEEIAAACHHFTSDRCISDGLSFVMYKASFGDDASSSKKFEATIIHLNPSTQVGDHFY